MAHWLSVNVWPFVVHGAAASLGALAIATFVAAPFRSLFHKASRAIDSLDPETDSGVTKQLAHIQRSLPKAPHVRH